MTSDIQLCSPSNSTYKPDIPPTSDFSIVSKQPQPLEEPDGVSCFYNEYYCTNSQAMSLGKDICKFNNPFFNKNKMEENTNT